MTACGCSCDPNCACDCHLPLYSDRIANLEAELAQASGKAHFPPHMSMRLKSAEFNRADKNTAILVADSPAALTDVETIQQVHAEIISDAEYAELAKNHMAGARLETHDLATVVARVAALESKVHALQEMRAIPPHFVLRATLEDEIDDIDLPLL